MGAWPASRLEFAARSTRTISCRIRCSQVIQRLHAFEPRHDGAFQGLHAPGVANRILDEIRRAARRPSGHSTARNPTRATGPSPLEKLPSDSEALERYEAALARLKPEDREAIIARIEMGCPYPEVAALLGKPTIAAAQMAVSRALARLAKEMSYERRTLRCPTSWPPPRQSPPGDAWSGTGLNSEPRSTDDVGPRARAARHRPDCEVSPERGGARIPRPPSSQLGPLHDHRVRGSRCLRERVPRDRTDAAVRRGAQLLQSSDSRRRVRSFSRAERGATARSRRS